MLRLIVPTAAILLASSFTAQAASLSEQNLNRELRNVAAQSSVGTPRAINEDILDQGYTVEGNVLINHLSVQSSHAEKMRSDPKAVYFQLGASVCRNPGFRKLMAKGAVMRYDFTEVKTNRAVGSASFQDSDCPKTAPPAKKK
ncbi:quorum-sensing-regulated virulence factor family protein [Pseudomonas sp. 14P_8.1_Bac3]|uniref:quorum-sensing-regulated virulence factor family protein n=1 Tax=Pseudomonas sp. 14P_8.1_Bac3 TaxID=2971621 RepID=UPI0021CA7ACC|nr:quorum-sensing-regulated virulence factor family protein [Pseudomonas sp. 14P_8.1_Bac3]MCU1761690.1 quorum-sensing-regulated virulence factor family protein [Pseudomonas sp. 14P_8.1_Bac3]